MHFWGVPLSPQVWNQPGRFGVTESAPKDPNKDLGVVGSLLLSFLRDRGPAQEFGIAAQPWHLHPYLISYLRGSVPWR